MNRNRFGLCLLLLVAVWLVFPAGSYGIPAFARKYGFNCMMCHTAYPKLNDWGQRFRDNGYQLPGQEGMEPGVFDTPPPIALRTSTGLNIYSNDNATTGGFDIMGLDLLAAGVLHRNVSVMLIYTPRVDEPTADYTGADAAQPGAIETASIIFSNLASGALNLRAGRFEPAYHLFSSKRSYYLLEPYEIYDLATPASGFLFNDNQIGIEATGHFRSGFKYALGVVNGTGPRPDDNLAKDGYLCLAQTLGAGDGQSAGQRLAAFGYYGQQPLTEIGDTVAPTGETAGKDNKSFYRYGGTASLNWRTFNLEAMVLKGTDDKAFNTFDVTRDYEFSGGFVELDYAGLWNNRLVASLLFNWIEPPNEDPDSKLRAYSGLVRYYLGDWRAVNVAIHTEYTHRELGTDNTVADDSISLLVDFAF
jgi:hypothetical protein